MHLKNNLSFSHLGKSSNEFEMEGCDWLVSGTPVNRIPIMAKQTLDLHLLFKLVVSKGGLVEVINRKLWREITKGLNLPHSITSAAFTLRTQLVHPLIRHHSMPLQSVN